MVTAVENEALTRVGPGTPMGNLIRRYWIPAAMCEELPAAGAAPIRVKLLGEALVAYRDPQGQPGLMKEGCPHRGASLFYARNEEGGLRCLYHGWKMCPNGTIADTPAEANGAAFASRLRHSAYPTREMAGILWTYMGPPELEPAFPVYPWMHLKPPHLLVVKMYQGCNYLQGLEGDLDPAHPNFLHKDFEVSEDESWNTAGWKSIQDMINTGIPKILCEETPYLMRVGAVRKTADPAVDYVRVAELIAPFYAHVGAGINESRLFKAWHPIDDYSSFTFYIHYDPNQPIDAEAAYRNWGHRTSPPDYRTPHTVENTHLQDREKMASNFSGIVGAAVQDRAVQESMGALFDRSQENLGTSDMAVIYHRRLLLKKMRDLEQGKPLPALDPSLDFNLRGASCFMPSDKPWQDAIHFQEQQELAINTGSLPASAGEKNPVQL